MRILKLEQDLINRQFLESRGEELGFLSRVPGCSMVLVGFLDLGLGNEKEVISLASSPPISPIHSSSHFICPRSSVHTNAHG